MYGLQAHVPMSAGVHVSALAHLDVSACVCVLCVAGDELADAVMAPAPDMPSIDKEVQAAHAKVGSLNASSGHVYTCYLLSVFVLSHAGMLKSIQ